MIAPQLERFTELLKSTLAESGKFKLFSAVLESDRGGFIFRIRLKDFLELQNKLDLAYRASSLVN